jgi:hypothetical protein
MPPVRSVKNQYVGINAHLHSQWQAKGGWKDFHTAHIVYLTAALKARLLPMGYTAGIEHSLQIRRSELSEGRPESDIMVYDRDPIRPLLPPGGAVAVAEPTALPVAELLVDYEELSEYRAIGIYQSTTRFEDGEPVAWIELLSPSNKLQDFGPYRERRLDLIKTEIVYVELDYLHESPPTLSRIPNYARGRRRRPPVSGAHPYHILVIDPRPEWTKGYMLNYAFAVDEPLPHVRIPLNAGDVLEFNFGPPYHHTLAETFFAYENVDYTQLPLNWDHYDETDQARIANRMVAVLEAARAGLDLETGPFPTRLLTLDEALKQIETLTSELATPAAT